MRQATVCCLWGHSLTNTQSPSANDTAWQCLSAAFFMDCWARCRWNFSWWIASSLSTNTEATESTCVSPSRNCLSSINNLGSLSRGWVEGSIVPILRPREPKIPFRWFFRSETMQIGLQTSINNLCLTICLRVIDIVLILNVVPWRQNNSLQNLLKNRGLRLLMMDLGNPCSLATSQMNTSATVWAVYGCFKERKWAYFDKRSTITSITSNPWERGKPEMKSKDISPQTTSKIGMGCNIGDKAWYLFLWQTSQWWMYYIMVFFIPFQ